MGDKVEIVQRRTFGEELFALSKRSKGLLNVHVDDGIYTEYPRLLKAFQAGKVLFSEPLSSPLVQGEHYFGLHDTPSDAEIAECYGRMTALLSGNFALRPFLSHLAKTWPAGGVLTNEASE